MTDYLLFLILLTLCLAGVPLEAKIKQICYIGLAVLGFLGYFGGVIFQ